MNRPRSSRYQYRSFVDLYKNRRLNVADTRRAQSEDADKASETAGCKARTCRPYIQEYLHWLWPHRNRIVIVFVLALLSAGFQMAEPLFMRSIVNNVLLKKGLNLNVRFHLLNITGLLFLTLIAASNFTNALKEHRQRILNTKLMLALRRSLLEKLLYLPLPTLSDLKTGGILSRLSGDVALPRGCCSWQRSLPPSPLSGF